MNRPSTLILLPNGHIREVPRYAHESDAEYSGRKLCVIEEWITGTRGPAPKGTRWAEWSDGYANGLGVVLESTGNPYADRTERVPGLYNLTEARKALGLAR